MKEVTAECIKVAKEGSLVERKDCTVGGVTYAVDGKHVLFEPNEKEREVARLLAAEYGKMVELLPRVVYPQRVQTPDYLIDGEPFDLKAPKGSGKNLLASLISKKSKQSPNFIFDFTDCPLGLKEWRMIAGAESRIVLNIK